MKISSFYPILIFLAKPGLVLAITATAVVFSDNFSNPSEDFQFVRRNNPEKTTRSRSLPPNGRAPSSRETKYGEAKNEAAKYSRTKLERSKSLPSRSNPVVSEVAEKERQAKEALKQLRYIQDTQSTAGVPTFNNHMQTQAAAVPSWRLEEFRAKSQHVLPHRESLARAYASAGRASVDADLTHRAMRNNLKAVTASVAAQHAKDIQGLTGNMMMGSILPFIAHKRESRNGGRRDAVSADHIQRAERARSRIPVYWKATQRRGEEFEELLRTGGQDSESEGYDSERNNGL